MPSDGDRGQLRNTPSSLPPMRAIPRLSVSGCLPRAGSGRLDDHAAGSEFFPTLH